MEDYRKAVDTSEARVQNLFKLAKVRFDSESFGIVGCVYCELRSIQLGWAELRSGVTCGMEMHVLYCTVRRTLAAKQSNQSINQSIDKRHQIARPPSPYLFQHLIKKKLHHHES
jgi:hypothetical protein